MITRRWNSKSDTGFQFGATIRTLFSNLEMVNFKPYWHVCWCVNDDESTFAHTDTYRYIPQILL